MEVNEFASLLNKEFKPQTDSAKSEIENAVKTLAQQALSSTRLISSDVVQTINAIIAEIDKKLSEQINLIMHQPEFQQLESAWRGLHYLVTNSETDDQLKIRVMNVSKKDLHKTLKRYKGAAWDFLYRSATDSLAANRARYFTPMLRSLSLGIDP